MRPRALIDLANYCRGFAVNLGQAKIDVTDITKGVGAFSSDLVKDIGYEIRDVFPEKKTFCMHLLTSLKHCPRESCTLCLSEVASSPP
jgi:hypothetical protein